MGFTAMARPGDVSGSSRPHFLIPRYLSASSLFTCFRITGLEVGSGAHLSVSPLLVNSSSKLALPGRAVHPSDPQGWA
jgi:hypothetical protein